MAVAPAGVLVGVFLGGVGFLLSRLSGSAMLLPKALSGPAIGRQPDLSGPWRASDAQRGRLTLDADRIVWMPEPKWSHRARSMAWRRTGIEAIRPKRYALLPGVEIQDVEGGRTGLVVWSRRDREAALTWVSRPEAW